MIDGERRGPYGLSELSEAGVRPDTYVWCKGMKDWEKAEDVADICRYYRQHIFDLMHPSAPEPAPDIDSEQEVSPEASGFQNRYLGQWAPDADPGAEPGPDLSMPPPSLIALSIALIFFCFPITGFIALYFAFRSRKAWEEAIRSQGKKSKNLYEPDEGDTYRRLAYDYARQAKMWCGITFFLGLILYAFVGRSLF